MWYSKSNCITDTVSELTLDFLLWSLSWYNSAMAIPILKKMNLKGYFCQTSVNANLIWEPKLRVVQHRIKSSQRGEIPILIQMQTIEQAVSGFSAVDLHLYNENCYHDLNKFAVCLLIEVSDWNRNASTALLSGLGRMRNIFEMQANI